MVLLDRKRSAFSDQLSARGDQLCVIPASECGGLLPSTRKRQRTYGLTADR